MELENIFYIDEKDWYKLQSWATLAYEEDKNEISGLMTAVPQKDGRFKVGDVEILKQENTGTNTELNGDAVSAYMMKYGMKYNNPDMKFVWWHSHHTMGAFWSGTDTNEIEAWKNSSFSLALVINLKEEYLFRVSFWKTNGLPIEQHIDTTLTIERKKPKINITDAMKTAYEELCSSPQINTWSHGGYMNYRHNPNQTNIWKRDEASLNMESAYGKLLEKVEGLQDGFMDGTIKLRQFKKSIKEANEVCKSNKYPFRLIEHNLKSGELMSLLMTKLPAELIEFDDNKIKDELETEAWNNSFRGFGWQ
jgi:proteasome lid subunit RPN8/RPN11